jgi:hypothetical protein
MVERGELVVACVVIKNAPRFLGLFFACRRVIGQEIEKQISPLRRSR